MLVNLLPDFLAVLNSSDRVDAYHRYYEAHRHRLAAYWNNYVLDPDTHTSRKWRAWRLWPIDPTCSRCSNAPTSCRSRAAPRRNVRHCWRATLMSTSFSWWASEQPMPESL